MPFCVICSLAKLYWFQPSNLEQQRLLPSDLTKELEESRKFSLNSLLALLAVLALSGSKVLQPVVLALLIYTISLRLIVNACFLESYPTLSRFLHAVPLFCTSCMAAVELVLGIQSPALIVVALFLSVLPLITTIVHHGRRCVELSTVVLPIRVRELPVIALSSATIAIETQRPSLDGSHVAEAVERDIC